MSNAIWLLKITKLLVLSWIDVFAYNEIGKNFYSKNNYHTRGEIRVKNNRLI
ncbi:MAG: hypothetical protein IJA94_02390 [Bacilli bacterium]|nr:hypothetical protein [Bacilli bacterium]